MAKHTQRSVDPKLVFIHSQNFWQAAGVLAGEMSKNRRINLSYAMFVNTAFSLELALKCLIAIEQQNAGKMPLPPREHNLKRLFSCVSSFGQQRVKKYAREFARSDEVYSEMEKRFRGSLPIETALEESSEAFEKLRYAYENIGKEYYTAHPIDWGVRKVIREYRPDWPHAV